MYKEFCDYLEIHKPDLIKYVVDVDSNIKIQPEKFSEDDFHVEVGKDGLILIIGYFHSHFDDPVDFTGNFNRIIQFCNEYMEERVIARFCLDQNGVLKFASVAEPKHLGKCTGGFKSITRSFLGTYNSYE